MTERSCSVCRRKIEEENPSVLVMTPLGNEKLLCPHCEALFETATTSHEPDKITEAMEEIATNLAAADNADEFILVTVNEIFTSAKERRELIESGMYDFENDDIVAEEEDQDVPEELRESEDDRELDRKEEEEKKKFDKIMNYVSLGVIIGLLGFLIYKIIDIFFI